jgi:hypothetical protein
MAIPHVDPEALIMACHPDNHNFNVRVLDDGTIIACHELMYTTALVVDIDRCGYATRYCYPNREDAVAACNQLRTVDDRPREGFIASRGSGAYSPAEPTYEHHGRSRPGSADRGIELPEREQPPAARSGAQSTAES